jgi:putative ABC transport system permease protein
MIPLSLRFAARELRSGVKGFRIFLACLALGVAAIAAAGSTAEAFRHGLAVQAREILGGDVVVTTDHVFDARARGIFARTGEVAYSAATRSMAEAPSGERRMVELRGVDDAYPLAGQVELTDAGGRPVALADALTTRGAVPGAAVEQTLLDRLGLKLGQVFSVGDKPFLATAVLVSEPDRLTRGFALGPRVLTRLSQFKRYGFFDSPGFSGQSARLVLRIERSPPQAVRELRKALPDPGLSMRERTHAAIGIDRLIDQLEYFLGFVGLASLVAGGLGVAGAVSAYLEGKTQSIAALKAVGATGGLIRDLYLIQISVLTGLGVGIGVAVGAAAPFLLGWIAKDSLPVPALFALYPEPLQRAALFGVLAAAAFSLGPLARARATRPSSLFRQELRSGPGGGPELVFALLAGAGLAGLAIWTAPTRVAAAVMIGAVIVAFAVLWLLGRAAVFIGGKARIAASGPLRIGLANLAGPHSAARAATPAIGLGVALLASVVLIQSSLLSEVRITAPKSAPALVFTEVPGAKAAAFDRVVASVIGPLTADRYQRWPFFTGRISAVRGKPVVRSDLPRDQRWAFDRDMPMAAVADAPANGEIEAGAWWPKGYAGPPLVSLDAEVAKAAGLRVGDQITLSVLGRDIPARIAVLRKADVGGFGPSFTVTLDPHALEGAMLNNVAIAKASRLQERDLMRALATSGFGEVNVISVREQLEAATGMFDRLALAVRGAASVAALAGLLVLVGAIAAGARARAREAATLKVLGASRGQILAAYGVEYGLVGLIAGAAGVALGYAAAWPVVVKVFRLGWAVDWGGVAALVGGAALVAGAGGLAAALAALAQRPAPVLRAE